MRPRDPASGGSILLAAPLLLSLLAAGCRPSESGLVRQLEAALASPPACAPLAIEYPWDETIFPPEIVPPTVFWSDSQSGASRWWIRVVLPDQAVRHYFTSSTHWTPSRADWESLKRATVNRLARVSVMGYRVDPAPAILSRGEFRFQTSSDEVGASLFYREVNLPFEDAVRDPSRIRWRFGSIADADPPRIVLEGLPVCGNCHSFSRDGRVVGMDVDYANSKDSYVITATRRQMALDPADIITWNDYRREDGRLTFGLLSQISPDGHYAVSTVKDRSVFVPRPDLAFSQLFFPIQGILAVYRRADNSFHSLPGADDPAYVQSNPAWSPDGRTIVFARSPAHALRSSVPGDKILLDPDDCTEFVRDGRPFRYDLYRVPFRDGLGGVPEPVAGASGGDASHYFPKFSPDGRWIVFCKARNYMLLQPDSALYIIPAEGGPARRLRANTARLNSWHSWSPNSRWLVFTSKVFSPYTQLFLTHIDEQGESSPPVWLRHFTAPDRAANIPEFVPLPPDAIARIEPRFLDDVSLLRAGFALDKSGDADGALRHYRQALALNPSNAVVHQKMGYLLFNVKKELAAGMEHTRTAVRLNPDDPLARYDLGMALFAQNRLADAIPHLEFACQHIGAGFDLQYRPAQIRYHLGEALLLEGRVDVAVPLLESAVEEEPRRADILYALALALAAQGRIADSERRYAHAIEIDSTVDISPMLHDLLGIHYARAGRWSDAARCAERALALALAARNEEFAREIQERLDQYRRRP